MWRIIQGMLLVAAFVAGFIYLQIVANSNHIASVSNFLRAWALKMEKLQPEADYQLLEEAYDRVNIYNRLIVQTQLDEGMVISRGFDGIPSDTCDSLLFSALRFTALKKLGMSTSAAISWRDIEKSQYAGHWYRHPKCRKRTSRDMITGLLIALSQKPEHYRLHLKGFINYVSMNKGFFSRGPLDVSYLTPGLAEIVRNLARSEGMPYKSLGPTVRASYSTLELDAALTPGGYRSHLVGLVAWLEFELAQNIQELNIRGPVKDIAIAINPFTLNTIQNQRLEYVTQKLVEADPDNLFFRYLRYRAANALTQTVRRQLLGDLLAMKEFPRNKLPQDCNRKADYLWQRNSSSFKEKSEFCTMTFAGVDFLWMAALLLEEPGLNPKWTH